MAATISEYSASINTPQMIKASMLLGGNPVKKNGRQIKYSGGFCVVFPFETASHKYAVRCWHVNIDDIKIRAKCISDAIKSAKLQYFVGFEYVSNGMQTAQGPQDIVVMDWVDAKTLKKYISENIQSHDKILALAESFKKMVSDLHSRNIAHGDLQHGNIMVKNDGSIVLVDYDSMYVPTLKGYSDDIKGLVGYQHPSRWKNKVLTEKIDYFSELVIYTSILTLSKFPHIWDERGIADTETFLFSQDDISSKGTSDIFKFLERDEDLKNLAIRLREYLNKDSIDDFEPLEKAIIDQKQNMVNKLSEKWGNNGYVKQSEKDYKKEAIQISKRWNEINNTNKSVNNYSILSSNISPQLLIILIDTSSSMNEVINGVSKLENISNNINKIIDRIIQINCDGEGPKNRCFITVIGYDEDVKVLASGFLKDLDANPKKVETIKKKVPDGAGGLFEVDYPMPIWVDLNYTKGVSCNLANAIIIASKQISNWLISNSNGPAPIVLNVTDKIMLNSEDYSNIKVELNKFFAIKTIDGPPLFYVYNPFGYCVEYPSNIKNQNTLSLKNLTSEIPYNHQRLMPNLREKTYTLSYNKNIIGLSSDFNQIFNLITATIPNPSL